MIPWGHSNSVTLLPLPTYFPLPGFHRPPPRPPLSPQVLQEALNANTSQLAALKLEGHRRSRELEEVKKEKEQVTTELNQIKAENSKSTSRIAGIMKIVEGFFVHRRNG